MEHEGRAGKSMQVIVLGASGGPLEDDCTALLVRSLSLGWSKGSVLAVDAGVHLSAIDRLLQNHNPPTTERPYLLKEGAFAGLELPFKNTGANAAHIARNLVGAHLITHPHLDHISGGVISTASPSSKPRKIAGLASTIEALKDHIFNDVIWPNLSDENGGVGLVTFMRLISGGSSVLGDGPTKGYMEVVDGLAVKSWAVSHGPCIGNFPYQPGSNHTNESSSPRTPTQKSSSHSHRSHYSPITIPQASSEGLNFPPPEATRAYTSSACFIHDIASDNEILIWGDVEPDVLSLFPRNKQVWQDAAPKIAAGILKGIFIECSYDDSRPDDLLFGHLTPRYVVEELKVLAAETEKCREDLRRRGSDRALSNSSPTGSLDTLRKSIPTREKDKKSQPPLATSANYISLHRRAFGLGVLKGVKIILIHVKDKLDDKEDPRVKILKELREYEEELNFGCDFVVSEKGMSVFL
ncbi:uncharacterized protein EAF02_007101 [Botrytis sinoallii]|uniref:uncharacterized protein n=1 Tax=Botrytis sinoallii TaxID=1463999 RepID=UPI001901FC44|nr:uncharacterized protein EAF02_007101 [Botrytis sinoallii]KAF7881210.1 hypothetical protein EAF02_007101 [Botrytis sinoallii]